LPALLALRHLHSNDYICTEIPHDTNATGKGCLVHQLGRGLKTEELNNKLRTNEKETSNTCSYRSGNGNGIPESLSPMLNPSCPKFANLPHFHNESPNDVLRVLGKSDWILWSLTPDCEYFLLSLT